MDDIMEMDLIPSGKPEEDIEAYYDINYENAEFEGERCGICMDVIVDRGVLDCCQHWFCFVCIDNWATITNLCPLCQNEFQLITCVPVYDTIGSNKVDEESFYRDDDWCVEGKSNISFPSYYIDENAVICLDGDGCKIRNGSGLTEGDSDLDTSIACDSCDTWYHAYCVEFDPEDTSESTWLCPRCVTNEQKSSIDDSDPRLNSQFVSVNALVAQGFSRKVSVSVADAGETALVVSMVGGNQVNEEQTDNISSTGKIENFILASEISCQNMPAPSMESTVIVPSLGARELELSLSHDTSVGLTCNSGTHIDLKTSSHKVKTEPISLESISSSRESCYASDSRNQMSKDEFNLGLHLGLPVGTFLSVDDVKSGNKDRVADDKQQNIPLKEHLLQAVDILLDKSEETSATIGIKRKYTDCSDHIQKSPDDGSITASPDDVEATTPKLIQGENVSIPLKNHADKSKSDDREGCLSMTLVPKDASSKRVSGKRNVKVDIMGIVRGTNRKPSKALVCSNSNDKVSDRQDNLIGLRVKKIMRRAGEDQESSVLVQKLRNEIREAVRNKCSKDFGENLLDTKLLAAFRAAVSGPKTESEKRLSALAVKAKKSMLQRGKTRDNLTKKIYGATNGRRKRAWDRDCEIEFWKHRCMRATKPEKVATLKSVLDLLRNGSQSPDTKQVSECQSTNPILSRLYLADTSVFPRNDDIKPLSAHKPSFTLEQKKDPLTETSKVSSRPSISLVGNTGNNSSISASRIAAAFGKGNHSGHLEASAGSKLKSDKEVSLPSTNARKDKRKWALEVLARKTADACSAAIEKEEDMAVLKGNYPLLAQLPVDMRPELAPSRHNKVPISIRQAQLYRLAEQFLKKANLPIMRRTAETELAIADAVNIEKEVADRSSSKLVYLNLCSQEILHLSDTSSRLSTAVELDCSSPTNVPVNGSELATELEHDPVIQEALRNAGLLSDSPLNSPSDDLNEGDSTTTKEFRVEEPDNVIEMNVHPDVDIYGDFEYDPEEENHFTTKAKTTEVPKPPDEGESKVKVILSTLNAERLISAPDVELSERLENVELVKDASYSPKSPTDVGIGTAPLEGETEEHSAVSVDPLLSKEVHEPSLAEYEELYGPETDPSIKKLPGEALTNDHVTTSELVSENKDSCNNGNSLPVQAGEESAIKCEDKVNGTVVNTCSNSSGGEGLPNGKEKLKPDHNQHSACINTVAKKVETYIKEHIRPLCKSGVITAEQYRWAVQKTTEKVMKYHSKDKNANFLIKEGEKVKKLAEQYVETAQRKGVVD